MLDEIKGHLKQWDWRLFAFILLFIGLPNVYQLYRVRLIGNELPDTGALAIVSQWQFVGLAVEVFQEATVLAIFFFLGSQIRNGAAIQLDRAKSVFVFIFGVALVFSVGIFLFRDEFITLIGTSPDIQAQTRTFLGISIFSVPFALMSAAIIVLFEALRLRTLVFAMAIVNVVLRFLLDSLFFGGYAFSLEGSTANVGWSTLLASVGVFIIGLLLLVKVKDVAPRNLLTLPTFSDMREYLRVGLGSGLDSLIRNIAYFFMIVRIVNTIGSTEIGGYYLAMQIFWSFMLVPVLALADSSKAMVANASSNIQRVKVLWRTSMIITASLMLVWVAVLPTLPSFARVLSNDQESVTWATTTFSILFVPYVLFSFNSVTDSVFYGVGKTKYLAYQSFLTNGTVYLAAFLLYLTGAWTVTFESVMLLFSLGILVDSVLTLYLLVKILYLDQSSLLPEPENPTPRSNPQCPPTSQTPVASNTP